MDGSWRSSALIADALLPPGEETAEIALVRAAVTFITAPRTFAKLNRQALWAMKGPGRRLYVEFANKKHLNRTEYPFSPT
ncbi:MAG: hypothetical protein OXE86_21675 [Alphaproteobacteria bacterium]|nr:hypothetical protein [Alphaproteobacteria bacterium]